MTTTDKCSMRWEGVRFYERVFDNTPRMRRFSHRRGVSTRWSLRHRNMTWFARYKRYVRDRRNPWRVMSIRQVLGSLRAEIA